jgi:hypothetical protein
MAQLNQPLVPLASISEHGTDLQFSVANDLPRAFPNLSLKWRAGSAGRPWAQGSVAVSVVASTAVPAGSVSLAAVPAETDVLPVHLELVDEKGHIVSQYRHDFFLRDWRDEDTIFATAKAAKP